LASFRRAGENYDSADLYCETAGYCSASTRHRAGPVGTAISRMTRKKQDKTASGTAPRATGRMFWERPLGTQESPGRPFPLFQGPARASVDAKPDPAVFRVIRPIVVPTGPGAMIWIPRSATIAPRLSPLTDTHHVPPDEAHARADCLSPRRPGLRHRLDPHDLIPA